MRFLKLDNELRMKSISKLTKSKEDNQLMIKHYAKIGNLNETELQKIFDSALAKEIKYLSNKKILKKIKWS
jgi:hypothetical protein